MNHKRCQDEKPTTPRLPSGAAWGTCLLVLFLLFIATGLAFADSSKSKNKRSKDLENIPSDATVDVIIQFNEQPTDRHYQKVLLRGGKTKAQLHSIKGAAFSLPARAIEELSNDPDVAYISPDRPVGRSLDHVTRVTNGDIARSQGWDGTGIGVAVVDSGITLASDLGGSDPSASRLVYSESFVPGDSSTGDKYGHGTHVAGVIASSGSISLNNYKGVYRGIAPGARIINLRVLDQNGAGTDSSVIAAIQRAIELKNVYNIRVLNLSLGRGVYESYTLDPLCQAAEAAWKAGIVVVVAAGNSGRDNSLGTHGYGTIAVPGNDPYVITVGATNMHGSFAQAAQTVASFSSKGPTLIDHIVKPDLVAPGNRVVSLLAPGSTLAQKYPKYDVFPCNSTLSSCGSTYGSPSYFRLSGTSMATPVVSGAAALLLQKNPGLTPDAVKARLMKTAYKGSASYTTATDDHGMAYSLQSDIFAVGAGDLDIAAALANTDVVPTTSGSAKSPQARYDSATKTIYLVQDSAVIWGGSVTWGTSVVWGTVLQGTDIITGRAVLWGSSVVWGTSSDQGFCVLWGSSVVWGTSTFQALSDGEDGDLDSI